jgi:hypothetical protein
MLGYDVEFGHIEAVHLLAGGTFSEKNMVRGVWAVATSLQLMLLAVVTLRTPELHAVAGIPRVCNPSEREP